MSAAASYPLKTISALLMLSDRRVQQLVAEGVIPKTDRGRYELAPVVQGYITYLKERAVSGDATAGGAVGGSLDDERTRKTKEEADKLEMENEVRRGQLLPRSDVDAAVIGAFSRVRSRLLGVPPKVAPLVAAIYDPGVCELTVRQAIYDCLRELSETNLGTIGGDDGELVANIGTAAGPDS